MNDCPNGDIRDLLPDLVHERLDAASVERVRTHITGCVDCTAEMALLARIRAEAESVRVPTVDVGRVVSRLPRAGRQSQRWSRNVGVRIAAGLVVLLAGASWMRQASKHDEGAVGIEQPVVIAQGPATQSSESAHVVSAAPRVTRTTRTAGGPTRQISLDDDLTDLSDRELEALLGALNSFEAVTRIEPASLEPNLESESLR